jgi:ElaB/YqjD/DUF883 family membrane-anchored ribosome-binding protein
LPLIGVMRLNNFHYLEWEQFMAARKKGPAATVEDIQSDVQELRDDLSRLAEQVTELVSDTGSEALTDVKKRIQRIRDGLEDVVTEKGQEAADAMFDVTESIGESVEEALRTRPMTSLAIAIGVGFLFGAAWRR